MPAQYAARSTPYAERRTRNAKMLVIGVTGGVGAGKSTVAGCFRALGAHVIDADALAHQAMRPGRPAWRRIVQVFGPKILRANRRIDRRKLAALVFGDRRQRARLERIVHPHVFRDVRRRLAKAAKGGRSRVIVLDVPLLVETGAHAAVDVVVAVTAREDVRRRRLREARRWSDAEISARMEAQAEESAKAAVADVVVENSGGRWATNVQVKRIWTQLRQRAPRPTRKGSSISRPSRR